MTTKIDEAINELRTEGSRSGRSSTYLTVAAALEELRDQIRAVHVDATHARQDVTQVNQRLELHADRLHMLERNNTPTVTTAVQPIELRQWDTVRAKPGTELYDRWQDAELVLGCIDIAGDRRVFNPYADEEWTPYAHCKDGDLTLVSRRGKPAEPAFKVGDWVRDEIGDEYLIDQVHPSHVVTPSGRCLALSSIRKIDPPAPRFTFGQRVRWNAYPNVKYVFLNMGAGSATIVDTYGQIAYPLIENVELDTDPF